VAGRFQPDRPIAFPRKATGYFLLIVRVWIGRGQRACRKHRDRTETASIEQAGAE
jgi:hypothetical protein